MAKIVGNDIASYQGDVNYDVYKNNTNFVIPKTTEGVGFTDPKFKRNQSEARRVGLLLGYYHFARPDIGNSPEAEADFFLSVIGQLREGEVLALDYEPATQVQAHVDWCRKWLDRVFSRTGVRPLIYLNQSQLRKFNWKAVVDGGYGLWVAAYTPEGEFITGNWPFAAMQQWTSSQKVPGIVGNVDGNFFFGDAATFKKYGYKAPAQPSSSVSPSKSPSSSQSPSPSPEPIDWEKKYKEEAAAHTVTKQRLQNIKNYTASQ